MMAQEIWEFTSPFRSDKHPCDDIIERGVYHKKVFKDQESMWECARRYMAWVKSNPWVEDRAIKVKSPEGIETIEHYTITKDRYPSITGFCSFLGIHINTLRRYRKGEHGEGFQYVLGFIEDMIRDRKMEGAAAGLFSNTIVARELGLGDNPLDDEAGNAKRSFEIKFNVREPLVLDSEDDVKS